MIPAVVMGLLAFWAAHKFVDKYYEAERSGW